jgi:hypothetical protein
MEKTKKEKKPVGGQTMSIIYIVGIVICTVVLITLVILASVQRQKYNDLKAREEAVVEEYNALAKEHANLSDPDYAEIYFDGNNIFIPSQDVIIEYHG